MTMAGMILGTAAYMAPEQAKGRPADKRSDIWAFACVLYEMLTGKRAFEGEDVSDTLAAVLRGDPDWAALPSTAPRAITHVLRRCLQRDPKQRLHDIADVRILNEELSNLRTPGPGETGDADRGCCHPSTCRRGSRITLPGHSSCGCAAGGATRNPDAPGCGVLREPDRA
jgi:serine/threonine protein kinase